MSGILKYHSRQIAEAAAAIAVGLVVAFAAFATSPALIVVALIGLAGLSIMFRQPALGLIGLVVVLATIIDINNIPSVDIGSLTFNLADGIVLALVAFVLIKIVADRGFTVHIGPATLLFALFLALGYLSTLVAILSNAMSIGDVVPETRVMSYYLICFPAAFLIRDAQSIKLIKNALLHLGTLVGAAMILQFVVGESFVFLPGRIESLETQGTAFSGVTRILPPGEALVYVCLFLLSAEIFVHKTTPAGRLWNLARWFLLLLAVLITFNRNYWLTAALIIPLMLAITWMRGYRHALHWAAACIMALVGLLAALAAAPDSQLMRQITAVTSRLETIGSEETLSESSLEWRYIENEYAQEVLQSAPLLGLGWGASYRPYDRRLTTESDWDSTVYIHNAHYWLMLKGGLLAYAAFASAFAILIVRGLKDWHTVADPEVRALRLGFALVLVAVFAASMVNPMFAQPYSISLIALGAGLLQTRVRHDKDGRKGQIAA
jgi:hypothetical protein